MLIKTKIVLFEFVIKTTIKKITNQIKKIKKQAQNNACFLFIGFSKAHEDCNKHKQLQPHRLHK